MNSDRIFRAFRRATIAGSFGIAQVAFAQTSGTASSQLAPPPAAALLNPTGSDLDFLFGPQNPESTLSFLKWGPINAHPHVSADFSYSSRLLARTGVPVNSVAEEFSPGVQFQLGRRWTLDYTPSLTYYSNRQLSDTFNHRVSLQGTATYQDWFFGLGQSYSDTSTSLIETGRQTEVETFVTTLNATHYFNSKWMLQLGADQNIRSAQTLNSSRSWSTMDWLNYQFTPYLSTGIGLGGGFDSVSFGSDMTFEQLQAQINARVTKKINFNVHGGGEFREFLNLSTDPLINPIYGASLQYRLFEQTLLSLSGSRVIAASLLQNRVTETTDISVGLQQRLLGALHLSLSGGFANSRYIVSAQGLPLSRQDDTFTFSSALSYGFLRTGSVSLFFHLNDNHSSEPGFGVSATRFGLNVAYRF